MVLALTKRENEIATLVAMGMCNKEIARQLGIRNQTVRNILVGVFRKTSSRKRTQLAVKLIVAEYDSTATGHREQRRLFVHTSLGDNLGSASRVAE